MQFLKIKTERNGTSTTSWYMVLSNEEEVLRYKNLDITLQTEAYIGMKQGVLDEADEVYANHGNPVSLRTALQTTHLKDAPPREAGIARYMAAKKIGTPRSEAIFPLQVLADLIDRKSLAMIRHMRSCGPLLIQKSGGWCDLSGYMITNNCTLLETLEKSDFGFPVEDEALTAQTLILENAEAVAPEFTELVQVHFPDTTIGAITHIRETDMGYIFKCIANATNIAISTQARDDQQVTSFIKLFQNVKENKNILIHTTAEGMQAIITHPEFRHITHKVYFNFENYEPAVPVLMAPVKN